MQKDWQEEQLHFAHCQDIIRHNIKQYETEFEARHTEAAELYKAINSGDVELYNQLMTATSLEEHAAQSLRKNTAALQKPYFGRIDYTDKTLEQDEQIYIGKNGIFQNHPNFFLLQMKLLTYKNASAFRLKYVAFDYIRATLRHLYNFPYHSRQYALQNR